MHCLGLKKKTVVCNVSATPTDAFMGAQLPRNLRTGLQVGADGWRANVDGRKVCVGYVQITDVQQGSADKEHVWSAKQLTLINRGKNTTAEA